MSDIAIYFGTDSGTTRLIAKKIAKKLGPEQAMKPLNINRTSVETFLAQDKMILGTPTYGEGILPGGSTGITAGSWEEFLESLDAHRLDGKRIALYGTGDQEKYGEFFVDAMYLLYERFTELGATLIGGCDPNGYTFEKSKSLVDGRFIGLALDNHTQSALTDERIDRWLDECLPEFGYSLLEAER